MKGLLNDWSPYLQRYSQMVLAIQQKLFYVGSLGKILHFQKVSKQKQQKSYSINVNISIKFTHDLNLPIFVVNDISRADKFCFTISLVTW